MRKFIFKFFILFVLLISGAFFSLIFFQKYTMQKAIPPIPSEFNQMPMYPPPPPVSPQEPPLYIPAIIILGLSSLFIFLLLKYLDKNFITPLIIIQEKLRKIKEGDLNIDFKTNSENKDVIAAFDTLSEMTKDLAQKEKLQESFIQNLAHDLRGPIIAQQRAVEILSDEFNNHELLSGLKDNSQSFLNMINVVIEAFLKKDFVINKTEFNLYKLAQKIVQTLDINAKQKNILINNKIDNDFIIFADYISFNRILTNLVLNAIDNIENDKTIELSIERNAEADILTISDNGCGIDNVDEIFKPHAKINFNNKKVISGLGLTIVKELCDKNDLKIKVDSKKDCYTKFIIEIPR